MLTLQARGDHRATQQGSSRAELKPKAPLEGAFRSWLPVEDYLQTSHGLVMPPDLVASWKHQNRLQSRLH